MRSRLQCSTPQAYHAEECVRPAALLIHLGGANVSVALALLQQGQRLAGTGHNLLAQPTHVHAILLAFMDGQLDVLW